MWKISLFIVHVYVANFRLDAIPRNLTTLARELFRTAVCLKPRLVHSGLDRIYENFGSQGSMAGSDNIFNIDGISKYSYDT